MKRFAIAVLFLSLIAVLPTYAKDKTINAEWCQTFMPIHPLGEGRDIYVLIRNGQSITVSQTWYLVLVEGQEKPFRLYSQGLYAALSTTEKYSGRCEPGTYKHPKFEWKVVSENKQKQTFKMLPDSPTGVLNETSRYCPAKENSLPFEYGECKPL
jgi:hypothetical protein